MRLVYTFAVAAVAVAAFGATAVLAQQNPIEQRKAIMKENGAQAKIGAAMAKGEGPFDLAKAKVIFATFEKAAGAMPGLFPPNSKTGMETTAAPKIWEDMAGFKARFAKFGADAKAAQAKVTDLNSFKTAFSDMGKQCGGCHQDYRVKK